MKTERIVRKGGKTTVVGGAPLKGLIDTCPFTGKKVEFKEVGSRRDVYIYGDRMLLGPFPDMRRAQYFFSTRNGVPPAFTPSAIQSVKERVPEEDPNEVFEGLPDPMKGIDLDDA